MPKAFEGLTKSMQRAALHEGIGRSNGDFAIVIHGLLEELVGQVFVQIPLLHRFGHVRIASGQSSPWTSRSVCKILRNRFEILGLRVGKVEVGPRPRGPCFDLAGVKPVPEHP